MSQIELPENQNIEINLLLEGIFQKYGYDFRNYSKAHIKRRLLHRLRISEFDSFIEMLKETLYNEAYFEQLLLDLSINVTEMYRDPDFFMSLRKEVIPLLKTYPFLKIWHAGCSSGEEVYSLAILLKEENLTDRVQIYATDFNHHVLKQAKDGIFQLKFFNDYEMNYKKSGGRRDFNKYFTTRYDSMIVDQSLKRNIVFSEHNLVQDGDFGEMNLILCRNVLIYFDVDLQNRVVGLFNESLASSGFLCLGSKESINFTQYTDNFEIIDEKQKIYKKIRD